MIWTLSAAVSRYHQIRRMFGSDQGPDHEIHDFHCLNSGSSWVASCCWHPPLANRCDSGATLYKCRLTHDAFVCSSHHFQSMMFHFKSLPLYLRPQSRSRYLLLLTTKTFNIDFYEKNTYSIILWLPWILPEAGPALENYAGSGLISRAILWAVGWSITWSTWRELSGSTGKLLYSWSKV